MENNFASVLIATILTCVLLIALMTASLVQVVLERKKHKFINAFIIALLAVSLLLSLIVLMYPASQSGPNPADLSRVDVPSTIFVDPETK